MEALDLARPPPRPLLQRQRQQRLLQQPLLRAQLPPLGLVLQVRPLAHPPPPRPRRWVPLRPAPPLLLPLVGRQPRDLPLQRLLRPLQLRLLQSAMLMLLR